MPSSKNGGNEDGQNFVEGDDQVFTQVKYRWYETEEIDFRCETIIRIGEKGVPAMQGQLM